MLSFMSLLKVTWAKNVLFIGRKNWRSPGTGAWQTWRRRRAASRSRWWENWRDIEKLGASMWELPSAPIDLSLDSPPTVPASQKHDYKIIVSTLLLNYMASLFLETVDLLSHVPCKVAAVVPIIPVVLITYPIWRPARRSSVAMPLNIRTPRPRWIMRTVRVQCPERSKRKQKHSAV